MAKLTKNWCKYGLVAVGVLGFIVVGLDRLCHTLWVGRTDLVIEFEVTEIDSQIPIPNARIGIQSTHDLLEQRDKQDFVLITNLEGTTQKWSVETMSYGDRSFFGFTNSYGVRLPEWRFKVEADNYASSKWFDLNDSGRFGRAHPTAPGNSKLVVRVALQKVLN